MILNTAKNRKEVIRYLPNVSEEDFVDEVVVPLFRSEGYMFYQHNSHIKYLKFGLKQLC